MATLTDRAVGQAAEDARAKGYDCIILAADYETEGVVGDIPPAYDYRAQVWLDRADHCHADEACRLEPVWCGADVVSCQGIDPRGAAL